MQHVIAAGSRHVRGRKRRAEADGDQDIKDLVGNGRDGRLGRGGEELGKGKRLGGVAAERGGLRGIEVREDSLVEAQVGPAGEEAKRGLPDGGAGEEGRQAEDGDDARVQDRDAHDAQRDDAAEEGNGVGGDELAKGHKKGDLHRDRAGNGAETAEEDFALARETRGLFR